MNTPLLDFFLPAPASSWSSSSLSSAETFFGITTDTRTMRSPLLSDPILGRPLPGMRRTLPASVPGGMVSSTVSPSSVFTVSSPPSTSLEYEAETLVHRLVPSRSKAGSLFTWISTYRSPGGPPLAPEFPPPETLSLWPSSIPFGMFRDILDSFCTLPLPRHAGQRSLYVVPRPWQSGHSVRETMFPNGVRMALWTCPWPPQVLHVVVLPSFPPFPLHAVQVTQRGTSMFAFLPFRTSLSVISRSYFRDSPCWPEPRERPRRP